MFRRMNKIRTRRGVPHDIIDSVEDVGTYKIDMDLSLTFDIKKINLCLGNLNKNNCQKFLGNPNKILNNIFEIDIGKESNNIIERASKVEEIVINLKPFNDLLKRHKSINFSHLFGQKANENTNSFIRRKRTKDEAKVENQVHPAEIRNIFSIILHKVITPQIYGTDRNRKKILKNLFKFLHIAKTEVFSLLPLTKQINVVSITWMRTHDPTVKLILVAKFLKWIFIYFILLLNTYFHITYVKEERIFLFRKEWEKAKKKYLKKMDSKMVLDKCNTDKAIVKNRITFVPKQKGIRTLIRTTHSSDDKNKLRQIISVLNFLYNAKFKNIISSFSENYMNLVKESNTSSKKVYIVAADISDAFGSIIQEKLYDILKILFNPLPEHLKVQSFMKKKGFYKNKRFKYIDEDVQIANPSSCEIEIIEKRYVLKQLEEIIFHTKVKINNQVYNLCKGVAQGLMLSSILSNIYYSTMQKTYFANYRNSGRIFSYVDDIIFFTTNEDCAKQFLNRVEKGIPEFNCWFKTTKVTSNLSNNDNGNPLFINHLGWSINSTNLEVKPKVNSTSRYSMLYSKSLNTTQITQKLCNLLAIKLHSLVLNKEINSKENIFANVKVIAELQAQRCFAIANSLSDPNEMTISVIIKTNDWLFKKIAYLSNWSKPELRRHRKKVLFIIWNCYFTVFRTKKKEFPDIFCELKKNTRKFKIRKIK